jgi:hypothetical protein
LPRAIGQLRINKAHTNLVFIAGGEQPRINQTGLKVESDKVAALRPESDPGESLIGSLFLGLLASLGGGNGLSVLAEAGLGQLRPPSIQRLLGQSDVKTTIIFIQTVLSVTPKEAKSPLDLNSGAATESPEALGAGESAGF